MPRTSTKPQDKPAKPSGRRLSVYRPEYDSLVQLLKQVREEAGLTQKQAGAILGVQQTLLSKTEIKDRRLDVIELRDLCGIYGISLIDFVTRLEAKLGSAD